MPSVPPHIRQWPQLDCTTLADSNSESARALISGFLSPWSNASLETSSSDSLEASTRQSLRRLRRSLDPRSVVPRPESARAGAILSCHPMHIAVAPTNLPTGQQHPDIELRLARLVHGRES
eukprot:1546371-Rhodomonas_salina.1